MNRELWFRGEGEEYAFDWSRPARELEVPLDVGRALYLRAMRLAADATLARTLYLRWLRSAAATRTGIAPVPAPGRRTQATRERREASRVRHAHTRTRDHLAPGRSTRVLHETRSGDGGLPGEGDVRLAMQSLTSTPLVRPSPDTLREQLVAAAASGRGAARLIASADPDAVGPVLRDLRGASAPGSTVPVLRLLTRAADGEVERVLGRESASAQLPAASVARFGPHVGGDAASTARLHTDDAADLVAAAHHARALTVGHDIYFARGEYAPGTERGDELIAHELTHVAQGMRSELTRAAAKGIDSGGPLDRAEAEADLRARLAVIQLHPSDSPVPELAAPAPPPTSDADRTARLAAQQQRITLADQATTAPPDAPPAPTATPQAPVANPPPPMLALSTPAPTGNAYVDTLQALPSRQAMELWAATGAKATTQAAADQARFDASLPPMPVALVGSEAPAGAAGAPGAPGSAGATASTPGSVPPNATTAPPAAQPTAEEIAAQTAAAIAAMFPLPPTTDSAQDQAQAQSQAQAAGQAAIDSLPTTAPAVATDPGTAPVTDLAGSNDPVRTLDDHQKAIADAAEGLDGARTQIITGPGPAQVQPIKLDQKLTVPPAQTAGAMPPLQPVEGMTRFQGWNLPANALAAFDTQAKPRMDASLAGAKAQMTRAETQRDTDRDKAVTDAEDKVKQAHLDADAQQQTKVAESRTRIANCQASSLVNHQAQIKQLDATSGDKRITAVGKINDRIQADQAKVDTDYRTAQQQAEDRKKKGEDDAAQKKKDAQDKAANQSWWDQLVGAISSAIQSIVDDINQILTDIGTAIGKILDDVKTAACQVIDAARDFVNQTLTEFGDWLKSQVDALIGSVFPELAAALDQLIDAEIAAARTAVNTVADDLKTGVTALCDGLKATIDGVIAAFKTAVQAAATLAQAAITGDWGVVAKLVIDGILNALGIDPAAFYALIGKAQDSLDKIVENPGAFVGHLVDAVKLGFQQFGEHFWTHLQNGLVQWLFGTFAEAGIRLPASFDIAGIFDLVCQILGVTPERLRGKVVALIGEENTERFEFVAGYIQTLITGGFAALWEKVQQDLANLWSMVTGGIRDWLITNVVQAALIKVATMWNPVGAIFQLIQTAWNTYQWLRENAQRIFGLVEAVVNSISNIVAGDISGAANFVEASLAKLVPIAISLFADLIGLGGIADQIKNVITQVQSSIDQAINALIQRVVALFKGGGKGGGTQPPGTQDPNDVQVPRTLAEPEPATLDKLSPELAGALAEAESGTVLYQADLGDPLQVTRSLLASHPDARYDPQSQNLTLPPLAENALEQTRTLSQLGQTIAQQTGVSKVTLQKSGASFSLHGHINPGVKVGQGSAPGGDDDLQKARTAFGMEPFTSQQLADLLAVNLRTAQRRTEDWCAAGQLYQMRTEKTYTFDPDKVAVEPVGEGEHRSMYVDKKTWEILPQHNIRDTFYKKRFRNDNLQAVLDASDAGQTNAAGEKLYHCHGGWGPNHNPLPTRAELEIDHLIDVTYHWNDGENGEAAGRDTNQQTRNNWYDSPQNLTVLCHSCNESKRKGRYEKKVGANFRGPNDPA